MKEQDAIELLKGMQNPLQDYANMVGAPAWTSGIRYVYPELKDYAIEEALIALKEKQNWKWNLVEERLGDKCYILSCNHKKKSKSRDGVVPKW